MDHWSNPAVYVLRDRSALIEISVHTCAEPRKDSVEHSLDAQRNQSTAVEMGP